MKQLLLFGLFPITFCVIAQKPFELQLNMIDSDTKTDFFYYVTHVNYKGRCINLRRHTPLEGLTKVYQSIDPCRIEKLFENKSARNTTNNTINTVINMLPVKVRFCIAHYTQERRERDEEFVAVKWDEYIVEMQKEIDKMKTVLCDNSLIIKKCNPKFALRKLLQANTEFDTEKYGSQYAGFVIAHSILSSLSHNKKLKKALYQHIQITSSENTRDIIRNYQESTHIGSFKIFLDLPPLKQLKTP